MKIEDKALAAKAAARIIHRKDGSAVIPVQDGLFDAFFGQGFNTHSRFRVIKFRGAQGPSRQLYQVSGTNMSRDLRDQLLKELS